ncbi:MAG TPA: hypothetical protein DHV15_10720 [Treponema sp.]|uniref:Uncharacterized protein n=1 Tax=Treponema denticola (strain ATCC 35405 / DSM 14222 / CIP 103919 / JCM 8153 / KCTC 15104) TaxID=243275 RepID=Q73LL5_TREDE|nr:hypothetical protein TDE_1847 [Treponema denticola ATCC 35405]HCY95959.1 hypothetical protein [Treponema sp.]
MHVEDCFLLSNARTTAIHGRANPARGEPRTRSE